MAVAPATGHLGAPLTSTLSKNKKMRGKMGPQLALCSLQGQDQWRRSTDGTFSLGFVESTLQCGSEIIAVSFAVLIDRLV